MAFYFCFVLFLLWQKLSKYLHFAKNVDDHRERFMFSASSHQCYIVHSVGFMKWGENKEINVAWMNTLPGILEIVMRNNDNGSWRFVWSDSKLKFYIGAKSHLWMQMTRNWGIADLLCVCVLVLWSHCFLGRNYKSTFSCMITSTQALWLMRSFIFSYAFIYSV